MKRAKHQDCFSANENLNMRAIRSLHDKVVCEHSWSFAPARGVGLLCPPEVSYNTFIQISPSAFTPKVCIRPQIRAQA